jgi:hypothetical protein
MKRFLFAAALVALVASVGTAEDKPATGTTTPAAPVVTTTTGTPVVEYAPAQTQRRGLFGRLRNRNNSTMTYSTSPTLTTPTTSATPMPGIAPQPMPMPGTRTGARTMTRPGTIIQATGTLPPGIYTTTDGTVIQIGGPTMTPPGGAIQTGGTQIMTDSGIIQAGYTEPAQTQRRGLFGRLRR